MTQYKSYAGIGSRRTPADVLAVMQKIAYLLSKQGWILRSGGADGADTAFETGCNKQCEIYLPWPGFNGNTSYRHDISPQALELASKHHPAWDRLSNGAKKLHARNCYQVLGPNLDQPVKFVICWHDNSGGTLQAVRLAQSLNIPIYNLRDETVINKFKIRS
jgi:hypothetical protein